MSKMQKLPIWKNFTSVKIVQQKRTEKFKKNSAKKNSNCRNRKTKKRERILTPWGPKKTCLPLWQRMGRSEQDGLNEIGLGDGDVRHVKYGLAGVLVGVRDDGGGSPQERWGGVVAPEPVECVRLI